MCHTSQLLIEVAYGSRYLPSLSEGLAGISWGAGAALDPQRWTSSLVVQ